METDGDKWRHIETRFIIQRRPYASLSCPKKKIINHRQPRSVQGNASYATSQLLHVALTSTGRLPQPNLHRIITWTEFCRSLNLIQKPNKACYQSKIGHRF